MRNKRVHKYIENVLIALILITVGFVVVKTAKAQDVAGGVLLAKEICPDGFVESPDMYSSPVLCTFNRAPVVLCPTKEQSLSLYALRESEEKWKEKINILRKEGCIRNNLGVFISGIGDKIEDNIKGVSRLVEVIDIAGDVYYTPYLTVKRPAI